MILLGISQQHKIILRVKAVPAFWQSPAYSPAHPSFCWVCLHRVGAHWALEWMKNSGEGKGQGRGSPNEASQGCISGLRTWQDSFSHSCSPDHLSPFCLLWAALHTLNRATPGPSDGLVLLNLVGITLGCLQLKNSYLPSKQARNRQRKESHRSSKSRASGQEEANQVCQGKALDLFHPLWPGAESLAWGQVTPRSQRQHVITCLTLTEK